MKKATVTLVLALFGFVATAAFSQTTLNLRADVPFAFSIEGRHYAAGPYELRVINSYIVRLVNIETGDAGLIKLMNSEEATGRNLAAPALRFVRTGERAYLISLIESDGRGWNVRMRSKDLEALRGPQSKSAVVAFK